MKKSIVLSLLLMSVTCVASELSFTSSASVDNCVEGVLAAITVIVDGGQTPYTVEVAGQTPQSGSESVYLFPNIAAGIYDIEVTDDASTTVNNSVTVFESDLLVTVDSVAVNCVEGENGSITVTIADGVQPYTVEVSDQATQEGVGPDFTFSDLEEGNYGVKVTDNLFCNRVRNVPLLLNNLAFESEVSFPDCAGLPSLVVTVTDGVQPYTVTLEGLTPQVGVGPFTFTDLDAGTYEVLIVDSSDCARAADIEVPVNLAVTVDVIPANCVPNEQGSIQITVEGGIAPFTVVVADQDSQVGDGPVFDFGDLEEGTYEYSVADSNSPDACIITGTAEVLVNTLEISTVTTPASTENPAGGSITVTVTGGVAPYIVTIPGQAVQEGSGPVFIFEDLAPGTYQVSVVSALDARCTRTSCTTVLSDNSITDFINLKYCATC